MLSNNIYKLSSAVILALTSMTTHANESANDKSSISGQVRLGYVNFDDNAGNRAESLAIGGKLAYTSPNYRNTSIGATFYTSNPLAGLNEEASFLDSNLDGYSILGEAYIRGKFNETEIKLGRQELDTPFAEPDDFGMIPNTFEGLTITNTSLSNTTLFASHLQRWSGVDAPIPEKFTKMNNDDGVNVIAAIYEPSDKWNLQGWHYNAKDATDISYVEAGLSPVDNMEVGLQYADQNGAGYDGKIWGISAEYGLGDFTLSTAYNDVSDGQVTTGFGFGPFFVAGESHYMGDVDNQQGRSFGLEYSGIPKVTLSAYKLDFEQGTDELDLYATYEFNEKLKTDLIYSDVDTDGKTTRLIMNYNF